MKGDDILLYVYTFGAPRASLTESGYTRIRFVADNGLTREYFDTEIKEPLSAVMKLYKVRTLDNTLTGDTYVKSLTNADTTNSNIDLNGYKLYVDGVVLN